MRLDADCDLMLSIGTSNKCSFIIVIVIFYSGLYSIIIALYMAICLEHYSAIMNY